MFNFASNFASCNYVEKYETAISQLDELHLKDGDSIHWNEPDGVHTGKVIGQAIGGHPRMTLNENGEYVVSVISKGSHFAIPVSYLFH